MTGPIVRFLTRLRRDQRGVSAVEFAFIAPVMILFYFGMSEGCQLMLADRRAVHAASAMGDLVAQSGSNLTLTGAGGVQDILDLGDTLMTPFSTGSSLKICLASITANASNVKTVDWSQSTNGASCPAKGATVASVPSALISASHSVIMSQLSYAYTGTLNMVIKSNPTITKTFYFEPRKVVTVSCATC